MKLTSLCKCSSVIQHIIRARRHSRDRCTRITLASRVTGTPDATRPISAKRSVKDGRMVLEERRSIAGVARPEGHGGAPVIRVRCGRGYVGGDLRALEEPDRDPIVVPKHCRGNDTSASRKDKARRWTRDANNRHVRGCGSDVEVGQRYALA